MSALASHPYTLDKKWYEILRHNKKITATRVLHKPKKTYSKSHNSLFLLVRQAGFEPATYGLEVRCSIQLSYWRLLLGIIMMTAVLFEQSATT